MMAVRAVAPVRHVGSVRDVLEWAFGAECASVEFDEFAEPAGIDTIWLMMQRGRLGCKVDGGRMGGGAQSASDAEIVAGVVAALPLVYGGRSMAVRVAELARAGLAPEYYREDVRTQVVPLEWKRTKHGFYAVSEDARDLRFAGFGRFPVKGSRACPVRIVPTAQQIGASRRFWLDWVRALMHIQSELRLIGLARWEITDELPPVQPWKVR